MAPYSILSLRTALETTISSSLGTYTLANGSTTPAVTVRDYGDSPPPGQTVTGVELIIIRSPDLKPLLQFENQQVYETWSVYLVDWTGGTNLEDCVGKIIYAFPGTTAVRVNVPEQIGPRHQMALTIPSREGWTA